MHRNLNNNDVQLADLCYYYDIPQGKVFLVYAPLAGIYFLADADEAERLDRAMAGNADDEELATLAAQLKDKSEGDFSKRIISHPSQYTKLSILPNLMCNLSCSYCYSARGRSKTEVSIEALHTMLDYFIDNRRINNDNDISIFISGGGEPTVSWAKVKFIVEYSRCRASEQGFNLDIYLMTNGTLISREIIDTLKRQRVQVGVSFEILPEVQNSQRGHYDRVASNLRLMLDCALVPTLSSVITELNVGRMQDMVDAVVQGFPGIRHLNFDPAMKSFGDTCKMRQFYNDFAGNFFKAKDYARLHGLTLDCNAVRRAEKLFPRYCQGKLCLTAEGKISMCHSISSPHDRGYDTAIYGCVENGCVKFDTEHFNRLVDTTSYVHDGCRSCIARWHCAGGCMMYNMNYTPAEFDEWCRFMRLMIGGIMLRRLDASLASEEGNGIETIIENMMQP